MNLSQNQHADAIAWMCLLVPNFKTEDEKWPGRIRDSWMKVCKDYRGLKKSASRPAAKKKLEDWEEKNYKIPEVKGPHRKSASTAAPSLFDIQVLETNKKKLEEQVEQLKQENHDLKQEVNELKQHVEELKQRPSPHTQKVHQRREQRHWETIYTQRETITDLEKQTDKLEDRLSVEKKSKRQLEKEFDSVAKKAKQDEHELKTRTDSYIEAIEARNEDLEQAVKKHKETNDQLMEEVYDLKSELKQVKSDSSNISLYDKAKNCYVPQVHKCVWNLIGKHVSYANVSHVIRIVLEMVSIKYDRLPSESTIRNMNNERTLVSQIQIANIASKQDTT